MLESLILNYGYLAIFIGTLLEGESVLILGGFLAHRGYLHLPGVMLMAFLGAMTSDHFFFYLGRYQGRKLLDRFPTWKTRVDKIHGWLDRVNTPLILGFRFLYGFRAMTPLVLGMSSVPAVRFTLLEAIGAVTWAVTVGIGGYLFGTILEALLGNLKRHEKNILLIIVALAFVLWLIRLIRNQLKRSAAKNQVH